MRKLSLTHPIEKFRTHESLVLLLYIFSDKKLRIVASTDSFLEASDFQFSEFVESFLRVP